MSTTKKPLISVIIPIFNDGLTFLKLASLFTASEAYDLQIICIDDQSTDDSYLLIQERAKQDKRIEVSRTKKNGGAAAARNLGLTKAKGDYVCFIDADDEIDEKFFELLLSKMKDNVALASVGILEKYLKLGTEEYKFCTAAPRRADGESIRHYTLRNLFQSGELYSAVTKIYRGDIVRKNKLRFDETMNFGEDTKFVLQYLGCFSGDYQIVFIPEPLYIYNYGTKTSTISKSALDWKNWQRSYINIKNWYLEGEKNPDKLLLKKFLIRYKISHKLAVARSGLNLKKQREFSAIPSLLLAKFLLRIKK